MSKYIKMGHEPRNKGKPTNKAWIIYKRKTIVTIRFGSVTMTGHAIKVIRWTKGYPRKLGPYEFESIDDAALYVHQHILRRENHGYNRTKEKILY